MIENKRLRVVESFFPGVNYDVSPLTSMVYVYVWVAPNVRFSQASFDTRTRTWNVWSRPGSVWYSQGCSTGVGDWLGLASLEEALEAYRRIHDS